MGTTPLKKPNIGRPSKFSPEAAAAVLEHVRRGATRGLAANAAGLGRSTFMRWMARGKKERRGPFRDFWDALKKAEAESVMELLQRINAAAERGTWQAAAWWLERRYPEEFSTHGRELAALRKEVVELRKKVPPEEPDGRSELTALLGKLHAEIQLQNETELARTAAILILQKSPNAEPEKSLEPNFQACVVE